MKKIAMLGDLHGNLTATLAMEKALKDYHVDEIWFLGDAVGKGPQSRETCDWVRANCTRFVGGNWDYGIGGKRFAADNYFWDQLGEERMNWLNTLPLDMDEWISGTHFRFFHGRPVTDLMLVQHDNYLSVYRRIGTVLKTVGTRVRSGETLGMVGGQRVLEFELWKNGQCVNPEEVITF